MYSVYAAAALNPQVAYACKGSAPLWRAVRRAFEQMTDTDTALLALQECDAFRRKVGEFGTELATRMAMDANTSHGKTYSAFPVLHVIISFVYLLILLRICSTMVGHVRMRHSKFVKTSGAPHVSVLFV